MSERIRPLIRSTDPLTHTRGEPLELARVPTLGEYLRLGDELYQVGNVVHRVCADVEADVYLEPVAPLPELPALPAGDLTAT